MREVPVAGRLHIRSTMHWFEAGKEPVDFDLMLKKPAVERFWRNRFKLRLVDDVLYYNFLNKRTADGSNSSKRWSFAQ